MVGGNGRHQVTLKALEEFHKQHPNINVKAEYTGWDGHLSRLTTQIAGGTAPVKERYFFLFLHQRYGIYPYQTGSTRCDADHFR